MLYAEHLGHCQGPIWLVDDFSECVQQEYFRVLLPLAAVVISSLLLIITLAQKNGAKSCFAKAFPQKDIYESRLLSETHDDDHDTSRILSSEEEGDEGLSFGGAQLIKGKTDNERNFIIIDKPLGQYKALAVEIFAVLALNTLNIILLATKSEGSSGKSAAIGGIVTWSYITILVISRLLLTITKRRLSTLWNHTLLLYSLLWFLSLTIFRSLIIHPQSRKVQITGIAEFFFTSLLFLIATVTRKGNRNVVMEWENNIEPSREPLASILSIFTFSWVDAIVWKGYKKVYELPNVWNLIPKDKAALILADFRQLNKTTALSWHLMRYFRGKLAIQCMFGIISAFFNFAPTLLLKYILEYVQNPSIAPRNVVWLYVFLLAFTDILRSACDGQALWIGRKICIRLRAIIIGELYAKALRRKATSGSDTILGESKEKIAEAKTGFLKKIFKISKNDRNKIDSKNLINGNETAATVGKPKDEQANVGTIINLMSVDSFKVSEVTAYLYYLLASAPAQLIIAVYLLYQILGYSSIPGIIVMVILIPINTILARGFGHYQKKIMTATDKRIETTNEVLQNIRVIKYFAWEQRFAKKINDKRHNEMKALRSKFTLWAFSVAVWNTVPIVITFFSFLVYTTIERKPLYPSIAFTAISLFNILRVPLDQLGDMIAHVLESKVSVDRVEEFLNEEETEKYEQLGHENLDENGEKMIGFKNVSVTWGCKVGQNEVDSSFRLIDLNIKFVIGALNIIAGPTGSGKTSLLMALLGEMKLVEGKIFLPGGSSRENVRPDHRTGLTETVAYCAQQVWLMNANIKENILFATPFNKKRYEDVIYACALERDLKTLSAGDQTLVGEKGIALSGGQKQRISLARALYSNSKHLLLDDCLSAVDSHSAKWIFHNCIRGPLMEGRTCILVTHNLALCLPQSQFIVVLNNGRVDAQGTPHEIIDSGKLGEDLSKVLVDSLEYSEQPSRVPSNLTSENNDNTPTDSPNTTNIHSQNDQKFDAMKENKAEGGVKLSVLYLYLRSMGPWWFWVIAVLIFGVQQLGSLFANTWIRQWANQYTLKSIDSHNMPYSISLQSDTKFITMNTGTYVTWLYSFFDSTELSPKTNEIQEVNVAYYLIIYAAIGLSCMLVALFRDLWLFFGSMTASWHIHKRMVQSIVRAKFIFFDVTPIGQMMNRFSKDLEAIDQEVAPVSIGMMSYALAILVTVSLITFITPGFLIAVILVSCLYFLVANFYLKSSRDLKRLESVQRSPLFQHFGETISGITTIRAFREEKRFIRDNLLKIDTHNRPFIFLWATNRWLAIRMDLIGDFIAFAAGAFVVYSIGKIDAGSAGLSLSYAISFTENVLWLVRLYAVNEQNMNSVERIKEYVEVEPETDLGIEGMKPPSNWPSKGSVEFINYTTKYRADLDPVLSNVSFKINPGEKIGIVGRTGAGKSSLALALFRGLEADQGRILVDDIDISLISLQDLRESITIVPQDPTLFSGTIRSNLDPFDLYCDNEIFDALRRVYLISHEDSISNSSTSYTIDSYTSSQNESIDHLSSVIADKNGEISTSISELTNKNIFLNLSSLVSESGSNLSQGQRQLLCLARAILKNPRVLLMDEATASIDYSTDSKIQKTIRELKSTTITIAHRLQTIVDYDKVLVLDHGRVVEFGHPWILLQEEKLANFDSNKNEDDICKSGLFRNMCEISGDFDILLKTAKRAWDAGRLVDLE
ncbi:ATP-dependent bile acid permease [Erysiphe neolycopersici]|uniref:ATP-dependent bile acid permease n=1 Tax=Erysiphe neolycopersici TaxID=212602 RepID=A0A420I469_9PEZI|nr:ATP-dependent bile acid permease [Erysiphe neolycopersici]